MQRTQSRAYLLVELIAVLLIHEFAAKALGVLLGALNLPYPDQPLLRHTYVAFATVLLLIGWLRWRGEALAGFGLVVPHRVLRLIGFGIALAIGQIVLDNVVRSITTPLIVSWTGANPHLDTLTFASLKGDTPLYIAMVASAWIYAGFGEEFFFRGYLLTRIAQLLGGTRFALGLAIVAQAVLFGLAHWYQGPVGMVPIAVGAVVSGVVVTAWGRNLWPAVIAHGLVDTLGFAMLYMGQPLS